MVMQSIAMPIQKLLCSTLVLLLTTNTIRANGIFRRTPDGVIVYPDSRFSGHTAAVRVRETESLITTYTTESSLHWQLTHPNDSVITLTTSRLIASVVLSTG